MSTPNLNYSNLDARYTKPTDVDTKIAAQATTDAGKYQRLAGPLGGARAKLNADPANFKMTLLGDSTSAIVTNAFTIYKRLLAMHSQSGEAMYRLGSADRFTDGVGNATTTFTSATANFTNTDIGRIMVGQGFPGNVSITAVTNSTTITTSSAIPSGTALLFWVGRHLIAGGNNGMPLSYWMANPNFGSGNGVYNQTNLIADAPHLTVASWLINDVRQGALGLTEDAIVAAGIPLLKSFIDWHRTNLPNTDLLLRMPNSLLSADVGGVHYVTDGTNTNPAGLAQIYSAALRRIYLSFAGAYQNVDVIDLQAEVFGTRSQASSSMMLDQLHPTAGQSSDLKAITPVGGGYVEIADALAHRIGFGRNPFPAEVAQRVRSEFIVYDAPAAGSIKLISRNYNVPASQAAVFRTDSLIVNGIDGPTSLSAATIDRTGANILIITGLGSTDFSPYIGQTAAILGSHAAPTTGESVLINFDLPSIAAGGTYVQTATVTGVATGNQGHRVGVIADPPAAFATSGLLWNVGPSGTDTVAFVFYNPTGSAIDRPSENWTLWLVR